MVGLVAAIVLLLFPVPSTSAVIDTFERGDVVGWSLVGDGNHMSDFSMGASADDISAFCLRLSSTSSYWCGVQSPSLAKLLPLEIKALRLSARGSGGCSQICIDIQQSDGSRWWKIRDLPAGPWLSVTVTPADFFAIANPNNASKPDLTKPFTLWFTMRLAPDVSPSTDKPAVLEIDDFVVETVRAPDEIKVARISMKLPSLAGVKAVVARTDRLPNPGQVSSTALAICHALERAHASVTGAEPGNLSDKLRHAQDSVLVWEGPGCEKGDWEAVDAFLRRGGALLWLGAGQPFSRPRGFPADDKPSQVLTQGTYHAAHALNIAGDFTLTNSARKIWTDLPAHLPAQTCRYLTTNDSIYLNTHWPWVDVIPLVTIPYKSRNWIWAENSDFTGTAAALYRHHSGEYAGARIALLGIAADNDSVFSTRNRDFAYMLSHLVKELAKPIAVDRKRADLPKPGPRVTPGNFFSHPGSVLGALDYDERWSDQFALPDYQYAAKRLGMNTMSAGIPWMYEAAPDGSVIDWSRTDKIVADAEKVGLGVVFDSLVFDGFGAYSWARQSADGETTAASIFNPMFRDCYSKAVADLAKRYKGRGVVAIIIPPHTATSMFGVDSGSVAKKAWAEYAAARGLGPELPKQPENGKLDFSAERTAYVEFWANTYLDFMRHTVRSVRKVSPKMPLLVRGPYMDVALSFRLASEFEGVAPHSECVETSIDVDSYMRGFAQRYGTPVSAENGWPKERGPALRMAVACTLLGGYSNLLFSFGGATYAKPGLPEFEALRKVWPKLKGADYARPTVGMLVADTTIWAANPPNYQWAEGQPNVAFLMERMGAPFVAVSAQWPKLDGLKVLVDDGRNYALTPAAKEAILAWIDRGGIFVAYPTTGQYSATGIGAAFQEALVLRGVERRHSPLGRVIVLPAVPTDEKHPLASKLRNLLLSNSSPPAVANEWVNQAAFVKGDKTYLVVYNKSRDFVGSFFNEIRMPAAIAELPNRRLTIKAPRGAVSAKELLTGKKLPITKGVVNLDLPATWWRVVEFSTETVAP